MRGLAAKGSGLAIAFSGGLDSLVLLQLCTGLGLDVLAIHASGPQFVQGHSRTALAWLQKRKIPHKVAEHRALNIPEVRGSHPRRCYYCKTELIKSLREAAGGRILCDGTHAGDLTGYRPGLDALREQKVISPFLEAGLNKAQIRDLAEAHGFDLPEYGGQNCLLTRFEYGRKVAEEELALIEGLEAELARLLTLPFRLRYLASGPELHVESAAPLAAGLHHKLMQSLVGQGLAGAKIRVMPKVSGFFDLSLQGPLL